MAVASRYYGKAGPMFRLAQLSSNYEIHAKYTGQIRDGGRTGGLCVTV